MPETNLGDGKYNEKLDKYGCPANCDQIAVPTMNPKIWDKLAHQVKRKDFRVTGIQRAITNAGAIWLVQPANSWVHLLTRETVTSSSIWKNFWLAVQMLLHCWATVISFFHYGNDLIRRWFHQKEYRALCSSHSNHREITWRWTPVLTQQQQKLFI